MCQKTRTAIAPFKSQVVMGVTYLNDADNLPVAAMCAPREDARGPLTVSEQKQWIADSAALFLTAPKMVQYIRAKVIAAAGKGATQIHAMPELRLLAEAMNTSVEFEWEQIQHALEAERRELEQHQLAA